MFFFQVCHKLFDLSLLFISVNQGKNQKFFAALQIFFAIFGFMAITNFDKK